MIQGHGDDTHDYPGIRSNFSSNIHPHADLTGLEAHLCGKMDLIHRYPEPEPRSLGKVIARKHGISSDNVLVTNGATDAMAPRMPSTSSPKLPPNIITNTSATVRCPPSANTEMPAGCSAWHEKTIPERQRKQATPCFGYATPTTRRVMPIRRRPWQTSSPSTTSLSSTSRMKIIHDGR